MVNLSPGVVCAQKERSAWCESVSPQREKYDLSSQLLAAKNEACELEIKLQDAQDIATKKKEEAEQLKRERDDLQVRCPPLTISDRVATR